MSTGSLLGGALPAVRHSVIGVNVSALDYRGACDAITSAAVRRHSLTVTAIAVHGIMTGALNREHRFRLNSLDMVLPDGQPVRWALNLLYSANVRDRVYGPTLMLRICERAEALGLSIGLYGNRLDVLEELRRRLLARFPRLRFAVLIPSHFARVSRDEQRQISRRIADSGADLLFVGLGCPRQEVWLYENRDLLSVPLIAVGAAFDFHAKRIPQAPIALQELGLEWLFRLRHEPRRLWRRYILLNPLFLMLLLLQILGFRLPWPERNALFVNHEGHA